MSALKAIEAAAVSIIAVLITAVMGAVIFDKINTAALINSSGPLGTTMTTIISDYSLFITMLAVVILVVIAGVILVAVRGFGGSGHKGGYED
jgi:intracellular septation protein A